MQRYQLYEYTMIKYKETQGIKNHRSKFTVQSFSSVFFMIETVVNGTFKLFRKYIMIIIVVIYHYFYWIYYYHRKMWVGYKG